MLADLYLVVRSCSLSPPTQRARTPRPYENTKQRCAMISYALTEKLNMINNGVSISCGSGLYLWTYRTFAESLLGGPLMNRPHSIRYWTVLVGVNHLVFLHRSRVLPQF